MAHRPHWSPASGTAGRTATELQALATATQTAQSRLHAYADDATQPAPTLADYTGMGVTGADTVGHNALNTVLAGPRISKAQIATSEQLQTIINSFTRILAEANEVPATGGAAAANLDKVPDATPSSDPLLSDYNNLGLTIWGLTDPAGPSDKASEHLSLLNDALHRKSRDQVDSASKLEALGAAVALFLDGHGVSTLDAAGRQKWAEAATLLGVRNLVTSGDGENLEALVQTLRSKSASQIDTVGELQALLDRGNQALNVIIAYATSDVTNPAPTLANVPAWDVVAGDDVINRAERTAGVTLTGSAGQNDVLTLFYPDGTVMKNGITPRDAGGGRWVWSYTLSTENWTRLGADSANGVTVELQLQARNSSTGVDSLTTNRSETERSVEITLAGPGAAIGSTSRATLAIDTRAADLDLDASQAGRQTQVRNDVTASQAAEGVKLIKGDMAAPLASDIASIVLTLPAPGLSVTDNILLGGDRAFSTSASFSHSGSIAGVEGLKASFDLGARALTIARSDGNVLAGSQVKAILEGLRYSFTANPGMGRQIDIGLVDQAGNISKGKAVLAVDLAVPPSLQASVLEGQLGYGFIRLADIFGTAAVPSSFPHVLSKGEQAYLPTPASFSAASLLGAIRGISAEWGGVGITDTGNSSIASLKSYKTLGKLNPSLSSTVGLIQQGSGQDALVNWLRLRTARRDGASRDDVELSVIGGSSRSGMDQYRLDPDVETSVSSYGLANIGVLYELNAGSSSGRPQVRVRYDGTQAAAGDVIGLYEGDRLVGSKVLASGDLGAGQREMDITVFQSLSAGTHDLVARYTDTGGNVVSSGSMRVTVAAGAAPVTLTELRVHGNQQSVTDAQTLGQSETSYAVISDQDTRFASGHGNRGPVFVGKVGGGAESDRYLVTVQMGGKIVAFEEVGAGNFSIGVPAGALPPGYYPDLSISATVLTPGARLGQTTTVQGLKLGWYWAAQEGTSLVGGKGNDDLVVGASSDASSGTMVQTGAGDDTITVGSFGKFAGLKATVSDFVVGVDKVKVFGQSINLDFVTNHVKASDVNGSTQLQIDLDGGGAGRLHYQLTLQGVSYNPAQTGSLFGL